MPRILIVDDDDDIRALIGVTLRADGYDVTEARDGREAVDALSAVLLSDGDEQPPPDMIITDVRLPGVSGMSLLAGIRAEQWNTSIIIMSAYDPDAVRREARYLGADAVFAKPFEIDELRTAVATLMARKRSGTFAIRLVASEGKKLG
jgi:DNA-binding response OmpR family regulator